MGQQQVHHLGIYDSKKRSVPQAVAMVGICTSGQQAFGGRDPVCRPVPATARRYHVGQRGHVLRIRFVDVDPGIGRCINQCRRTSGPKHRKQQGRFFLAQTGKPAGGGQDY